MNYFFIDNNLAKFLISLRWRSIFIFHFNLMAFSDLILIILVKIISILVVGRFYKSKILDKARRE